MLAILVIETCAAITELPEDDFRPHVERKDVDKVCLRTIRNPYSSQRLSTLLVEY
jgi:hypothetical protein